MAAAKRREGVVARQGAASGEAARRFVYVFRPMPPETSPQATDNGAKRKTPGWAIALMVLAGLAFVGILFLGITAALGVRSYQRFLTRAKAAEANSLAGALALGITTRCAVSDDKLPPTSPAVPSSLAMVRGGKYTSSPSDWAAPAFTCAGFTVNTSQYYRYQWIQLSPTTGEVVAEADFDGDGRVDGSMRIPITCARSSAGLSCDRGAPTIVDP